MLAGDNLLILIILATIIGVILFITQSIKDGIDIKKQEKRELNEYREIKKKLKEKEERDETKRLKNKLKKIQEKIRKNK